MVQSARIGFIGLGSIGKPMAQTLSRSPYSLTLWARRPEVLESFADSVQRAVTPAQLGQRCDVVGLCVFDAHAVDEVMFGRDGLVEGLEKGSIVMVHSTVPPDYIKHLGKRAASHGIRILDAPISGGPVVAATGELTIMVGGDTHTAAEVAPVLSLLGSYTFFLGGLGSAQQAKLLNNALLTAQLALVNSMLEVATHFDISRSELLNVIGVSSGRSFASEMFKSGATLEHLAAGAAGSALTKDVEILRSIVDSESEFLVVAQNFIDKMAQTHPFHSE